MSGKLDEIRGQFAKNEILVKAMNRLPEKISGVDFIVPENGNHRLHLKPGVSANEVLADLVKSQVILESFEMEQPSLDEIFIQTVTGKAF